MAQTNIVNTATGQTGYQVPGQAAPAGWTSSGAATPSQVSNAVSTSMGGAVNAQGQQLNSSGQVTGMANPKDAPGYVPGTLPNDHPATPPSTTPPTDSTPPAKVAPTLPNIATNTPQTSTPQTPSGIPGAAPLTGTQSEQATQATDQLKQKYGQALTNLTNSGVPSPSSPGSAGAGVTTAINNQPTPSTPAPTTTPNVDNFFNPQNNPALQQSTQDLINFLSPPSVQKDISDAMSKLVGDQNTLSSEKLQLMNMQNVMAGTPDDIRDEVTKANGFATESQVQAMAVSRNKVLLKQASFLQQQMQYQQDLVSNDTSLMNFEKDMANTQFTQRLGILTYQQTAQNNMTNAARDSLKAVATAVGYDGLYKSVANDPTQMARDEQVLGLAPGGLAKLAATPTLGSYQVVKGGTDAFGNTMADKVFNSKTGQFVNGGSLFNGSGGSVSTSPQALSGNVNPTAPIIGTGGTGTGTNKLSFDQYGLLANTDFNPKDMVDSLAQKYIDQYVKNGTVPTASSLGRNMKPEAMAQVDSRARDLYYKATGEPMPNPEIIKGNQKLINSNNSFANNLKVQEQTVKSNFGLNLENLKASDLNTSGNNAINTFLDNVKQYWLGNPEAAQYALQNSTIQNEVGSLLAVRNASGTTVHDKLAASGLIPKGATLGQQTAILKTLMQEADNAKASFSNATGDLYKQVDPLMQDSNNPLRSHMQVESALNKAGIKYQDAISKIPVDHPNYIPVIDKQGNFGYIAPEEFSSNYTKI